MHPGSIDASAGLLTQFLAWIAARPRTYGQTMEAWRTSCPRISAWEDALLDGLVAEVETAAGPQHDVRVVLTAAGQERLAPTTRRPMLHETTMA